MSLEVWEERARELCERLHNEEVCFFCLLSHLKLLVDAPAVVRLFNVIQQSQASATTAAEDAKANRGTGKPSLPAPVLENKTKGKGKNKDNIIGRGKESTCDYFPYFP